MAMLTKNYQSKATGFFVLTAIVLLSGAGLLLAKPVQLVVQNLKGSAHVFPVRSGKQLPSQKKALKNGSVVQSGQAVQTAAGATLHLQARNLSFRVGPSSTVQVDQLAASGQNKLHVAKGNAWFHLKKGSGSKLNVSTPTAVASVRGTKFAVVSSEAGTLTCVCKGGITTSAQKGSSSSDLEKGDSLSVGPDGHIQKKDLSKYFKGAKSDPSFAKMVEKDKRLAYCLSCHPAGDIKSDTKFDPNEYQDDI